MGNSSSTNTRNSTDYVINSSHTEPIQFHENHSTHVQLSVNSRRATRVDSFCQGICFGSRPVEVQERVHICFADITTNWSGVLRFGFTHRDPSLITCSDLPRYACPELTNLPGFWARAIPESIARVGTVMSFYMYRNGDLMYCVNGSEQGVFLSGIETSSPCWPLLDIYGNTVSIEFVDGVTQNNQSQPRQDHTFILNQQNWNNHNVPTVDPSTQSTQIRHSQRSFRQNETPTIIPDHGPYVKICFHKTIGRNICLSPDHAIAVRLKHEFCSGYVFSERPITPGETLVIQLLSVIQPTPHSSEFGGLAFGMTSCDPASIKLQELPDDSDFLLDRSEYWVVNKDVNSTQPLVGDRLGFHFTTNGEIRFLRNNYLIGTLMHVDHSLPLWMFFDVFGNTQKIKILGILISESPLMVVLPPSRPPQRPPSLPPKDYNNFTLRAQYKRPTLPPPLIPTPVNQTLPSSTKLLSPPINDVPIKPPKSPVNKRNALPPPRPTSPPHFLECPDQHPRSSSSQQLDSAANKLRDSLYSTEDSSPLGTMPTTPSESPECSVCLENGIDCVLYTCGHMCLCYDCADEIMKSENPLCPMCRSVIKDVIRTFQS